MTSPGRPPARPVVTVSRPRRRPARPAAAGRPPRRRPWRLVVAVAVTGTLAGLLITWAAAPSPARAPDPGVHPPPLPACLAAVPCYGQDPLHRAYDLGALYRRGITGAGTTIALVVPGANPWLRADLATYDRFFRLPPARLTMLTWGHPSAARPAQPDAYWAQEGTAYAELAHFTAPGARLVYVQIPVTRAVPAGLTDPMTALAWAATRQHLDVASFSWGVYENQIPHSRGTWPLLPAMRAGLITATRHGVTVIAASGDGGPTASFGLSHLRRARTVAWPASDPLVTAVGATVLHLTPAGQRTAPDTVYGASAPPGGYATGAGTSAIYPRPAYQNPVAATVGGHRGVADVAMDGCAWVYLRIPRLAHGLAWYDTCGTSFAAPLFAGITADAAQIADHPLGPLNPDLYQMHGPRMGVLDVTHGTDSLPGIPGYSADPGYDLPSGIGTISDAYQFTTTLAHLATTHSPGPQR